jgi:hypothetical protein
MSEREAVRLRAAPGWRRRLPPLSIKDDGDCLFSEEQYKELIMGLTESDSEHGLTMEEVSQFVKWCQRVRTENNMLELLLLGKARLVKADLTGFNHTWLLI